MADHFNKKWNYVEIYLAYVTSITGLHADKSYWSEEEDEFDSSDIQEIISGIGQPVTPHTQPTPQFLLEINEEDSWEVQETIMPGMVIPPTQLTPQFSEQIVAPPFDTQEQDFEDVREFTDRVQQAIEELFNVPAEEDNGFTG